MTRKNAMISSTIAGAMLLLAANSVSAAYYGPCAPELNAVRVAIVDSQFTGMKSATDQSNLLAKLTAAEAKVSLTKYSDAIDKLQDISDTATALAGAAKPKLTDATAINNAVIAATACVGTLR
jgi:hypothetical protein